MEILNEIYSKVFSILYADYILATILTTYLVVKYILPNTSSDNLRARINIAIGIVFGICWWYFGDMLNTTSYLPQNIFISMLTTVTIYQWFIKYLLKKFGIDYSDADPELIKKITEPTKPKE